MDAERLESALLAFVQDEILDGTAVARNTQLLSSGLVDSARLVTLATFVERRAGIEIPDRDINAEHFEDVESILAYVRLRREA
jgi:acyl carrier protein